MKWESGRATVPSSFLHCRIVGTGSSSPTSLQNIVLVLRRPSKTDMILVRSVGYPNVLYSTFSVHEPNPMYHISQHTFVVILIGD
jgi:hypothetical protein